MMMTRKQSGFTLVELMVTMVIFVLVIAAASNMFTGILNQFKQQSKIAESNIEGVVGLQMLRSDIEQAGYGLPYDLAGVTYDEAENDTTTAHDDTAYNDATANPPRALVASNNDGVNTSDILVVKATNVAISDASSKWTYLFNGNTVREWMPATERLETSDRVIVLRTDENRTLVVSGGSFTTRYAENGAAADNLVSAAFAPPAEETRIVYGVTPPADPVAESLRMPFNRADFYVRRPATNMPSRCAPGTGNLYKATVNHDGGGFTELPLLDCVADMQLALSLDMDEDGAAGTVVSPGASALTSSEDATAATVQQTLASAALLRTRLKNVRVYILAHEGQRDTFYTYPNATINLTDPDLGALKAFNLSTVIGSTYVNYRWKIYTMTIKPFNLR